MNIFYLSDDPTTAAQWQCDRHVVKMVLESAQLLSTAHRECDGDEWADEYDLYKRTHKNHPSAVWARASTAHYRWLYSHFFALCGEYRYRYGKEHKTWLKIGRALSESPDNCPVDGWTCPPQCMPDMYKNYSCIKAYRDYYRLDKSVNDWFYYNRNRCRPWWLVS